MNHHASLWKPLIFQAVFALACVLVTNAAEPQEAVLQTSQLNPAAAVQPTVKPPQVTYEDGQLTVIAENSTLSDVMKALRAALGADIDLPPGVVEQHIWVHLGPGPARSVLRDLLDSTEFNYMIQASEDDADGIRSILLTQRSKSTGSEAAGSAERPGIRTIPSRGPDVSSAPESENPAPEPVASVEPSQATPSQATATPSAAPVNNSPASASLQNTPGSSNNGVPGTGSQTDQMIQQMQSMYEQRRQLQMQQNRKPTGQN